MWSLKNGTDDLSTKQKLIVDLEDRLVLASGEQGDKETDREFGIGRCKLFHLGLPSNGVLLYSTGSCAQSQVRTGWKIVFKKKKRKNVCVCIVAGSLCYTAEIEGTL